MKPRCRSNCYIFANFVKNPTLILNLTISTKANKDVSNDILSVWKYCQLFTHKSNTFLLNKQKGENSPKPPNLRFPLQQVDPYLIHQCLDSGPTTLTTPNDIVIGSCISTQLCNKVPSGYNGTLQIHPQNCPSEHTDQQTDRQMG